MSKKQKNVPNRSDITRHLRRVNDDHPVVIQTYPPKHDKDVGSPENRTFKSVSAAVDFVVDANVRGMNVGFVPNPMDGRGRKAVNCKGINWLVADYDSGSQKLEDILELPVKPNLVVETSRGNFHAYFNVIGCAVKQFTSAQKALAAAVGSDPSVSDPSRCMRIAGTINWNHEPHAVTRIVYPEPRRVLKTVRTLAQLSKALKLDLVHREYLFADGRHDAKALLQKISPEDREVWRNVGMALHTEWPDNDGFNLWSTWSQGSKRFDPGDQQRTWDGFKASGGITIGTLVHLAGGGGSTSDTSGIPDADERSFADAIAAVAHGKLAYDPKGKTWYEFTGVIWEASKGDHLPLKFVRDWLDQVGREVGDPKAVAKLQAVSTMSAALRQLQLDTRIIVDVDQFDKAPHLLAMKNGVVDMRTGDFRAGRAEDLLTLGSNVNFDPAAQCPLFREFLKAVTKERKGLTKYILSAMGYSLTGLAKEHKLFMLQGTTRNGKGILMNTFAELMGRMAVSVNPSLLMHAYSRDPNAAASALMRIRGARLLVCTELTKGKPFDEAFIKQLTGGDKLAGRENYGQQQEFEVNGKLWVSSNSDPEISYGAEAMWARIVAIPFDVRFDGEKGDKDLKEKLLEEGPGIMNLLIKRAGIYFKEGLPACEEVVEATAKLRERLDTVRSWIDGHCRESEKSMLPSDDAYRSYKRHCRDIHRATVTRPAFKAAMVEKGFASIRRSDANYFRGLRLLNE